MLCLRTIGPVSIQIGDGKVSPANQQVFSTLLYLAVERGKQTPRRALVEMFFPDASDEAGNHSLRQLIYRLRKLGADIETDSGAVSLSIQSSTWDVDTLLASGWATIEQLQHLAQGYLADYSPRHSDRFTAWLDSHRDLIGSRLRQLLVAQLQSERARKRFRAVDAVARACLALDPLNEEATLAAAESLAITGAKAKALSLLDNYLDEIGSRSRDLRIAPRILRERISEYVSASGSPEDLPLIGRDQELEALLATIEQAASGTPRACVISGPSGIGKTRLVNEACRLAALAGRLVVSARLHSHDARRPFSILRDLAPRLLDLPGALGASPEALACVQGLCGRGPSTFQTIPTGALEAEALAGEIKAKVTELIDAITAEQPLIIFVEDAHWIDEASLELIGDWIENRRALSVLLASQRVLRFPARLDTSLSLSHLPLCPLGAEESRGVIASLFESMARVPDSGFIDSAISLAGGFPFYLQALFRAFLETSDPEAHPESLATFLNQRIAQLPEPARSVFDAIVILGAHCNERLLARIVELPRHELLAAIRLLDSVGLIHNRNARLQPAHDLFSAAAMRSIPASVARLLHRTAGEILELEPPGTVEPLALAAHWEACDERVRALDTLTRSADECLYLGRPREAIDLLKQARALAKGESIKCATIDIALFSAYKAAGDFSEAIVLAENLGLIAGSHGNQMQLRAIETLARAGRPIVAYTGLLDRLARHRGLPDDARAMAAKLLQMVAEDTNDERLGRDSLEAISDINAESVEALSPSLIYETVFGDKLRAQLLARKIYDLVQEGAPIGPQLDGLHNGSLALWRIGQSEEALELLQTAYKIARGQRIWSACVAFSGAIADMFWQVGRMEKVDEWLEQSRSVFGHMSFPEKGFQYFALRIVRHLERGDPDSAEEALNQAELLFPAIRENRHGLERLAYRVRIAVARGQSPRTGDLEELLAGHMARRDKGLHDVVADALVGALIYLGRGEEAAQTRDEYLGRYRRDGFQVAPTLIHLNPL